MKRKQRGVWKSFQGKMFGWAKDFCRRHKKKIVTLGVVACGVYSSYKVLQWKIAEWREKELEDYAKQAKKQFHFERNQKTCSATFMQLMVPLRNRLFEIINVEEITAALKDKPENKVELWEELKLLSVTRTLTSIVSTCTLYVFLQVQMNIIAGYMYLENMEYSGDSMNIADVVHHLEMDEPVSNFRKEYLDNIRFLLEKGILQMTETFKKLVYENLASISLKSRISHYEISKITFNIWNQFRSDGINFQLPRVDSPGGKSPFSKYILNAEDCKQGTMYLDEEKYQQMMLETFDVVDSEDFGIVLSECVQECLEYMMQSIEPHFQNRNAELTEAENDFGMREVSLPLAKIVPIINSQSNQIFKAGRNEYLDVLFSVESINAFSANIYESFSCQKDD